MTNAELDHDDLEKVKLQLAELRASQGRVSLPPALMALLWAMLLACFGAVGFVAHLDARVVAVEKEAAAQRIELNQHFRDDESKAEHIAIITERQNAVLVRLSDVERQLDKRTR